MATKPASSSATPASPGQHATAYCPIPLLLQCTSVSQLLARDYVFIDTRIHKNFFDTREKMVFAIQTLISQLDLSRHQTLFIKIDGAFNNTPEFIRQEINWQQHTITELKNLPVKSTEQLEFITMIWECSAKTESF